MTVTLRVAHFSEQSSSYIVREIESTEAELDAVRACQRMVLDLLDSATADRKFAALIKEKQEYRESLWAELYRRGVCGWESPHPIFLMRDRQTFLPEK